MIRQRAARAAVVLCALGGQLGPTAFRSLRPSGGPVPTDPGRQEGGPIFTHVVDPFPVFDASGHRYGYPFLGGLDHPRPQLVDIDGDGDLDLFVQEYGGSMMFFENAGTRDFPAFTWHSDTYQDLAVGEWSRFVDVDGDGDLDLFAESPFSYIRIFRNEGSPSGARYALAVDTLVDVEGKPIFNDRQNIPQIVDMDCDGKLDLLVGRTSGMVTHYREEDRDGRGLPRFAFVTDSFQGIRIVGQQFSTRHGANTMIVRDLDGDGAPDILWGDYFEAGLLWLRNAGTCQRPLIGRDTIPFPPGNALSTSGYNAPALADLDGDGDLDLTVGVLGGAYDPDKSSRENLYYLEQTESMQFSERTRTLLPSIDVGSESTPGIVDLDGDGLLDLVVGNKLEADDSRTAGLYVFRNRGTPGHPELHEAGKLPIEGRFHYAPAFGDLDGDGRPDMVVGTWTDALLYYHNDGPEAEPQFELRDSALVTLTRGSYATPALVDIDEDGDLDLFVGESSGELNYYRNVGTPTRPSFELVSDDVDDIKAGRRSAPAFTDLDGDGRIDLVLGTEAGPAAVYRNVGSPGAPRFEREDTATVALPPISAPTFGDLDGDGRPELLAGTASGGVAYFTR